VADPKPSLLERILATACPEGCVLGTGLPCMGPASHMMFCASRIHAAEEAEAAKPKRQTHPWRYLVSGAQCLQCCTIRKTVGPSMYRYSHDGGVSWARGPDPCPGRTSTDATKGDWP
jgi:hypothetical protein